MTVAYGFLGTTQDKADGKNPWRPTVSLCRHYSRADSQNLSIDVLNLLYNKERYASLAEEVKGIIEKETPTRVRLCLLPIEDPWDFAEAYQALEIFSATNLRLGLNQPTTPSFTSPLAPMRLAWRFSSWFCVGTFLPIWFEPSGAMNKINTTESI